MKKFLLSTTIVLGSLAAIAGTRGLFNFVAPSVNDSEAVKELSDIGTILYDAQANRFVGLDSQGTFQPLSLGTNVGNVVSPASAGTMIASAKISYSSGVPTVSSEDGDWISGNPVDNSTGNSTLNFVTGIFGAAPHCVCSPFPGVQTGDIDKICEIDGPITSNSVRVLVEDSVSGAQVDTGYYIICVGAR